MDLQLIRNSMIVTFMGALLDFFISVIRGFTIKMSAPVYEQYRCLTAQYKKKPDNLWVMGTGQTLPTVDAMENLQKGGKLLLETTVQPEQFMILQLVDAFIDDLSLSRVHHHQSQLNLLAKSKQKEELQTSTDKMDMAMAASNLINFYSEPNFCYFFIDSHTYNPSRRTRHHSKSVPFQTDKNNNSNIECCVQKTNTSYSSSKINQKTTDHRCNEFFRRRSISECSEDSFICFADEVDDDNVKDNKHIFDSDTDDDETETDEDDDSDNDEDDVDMCSDIEFDGNELENILDCNISNIKKVRFNMKPKVHFMYSWEFAYRSARKGDYWQIFARDHERFQKRIFRTEKILNRVLKSEHRQKIFAERFHD